MNIDDCDQLCVNDIGSYHCECHTGYIRANNSCVGKFFHCIRITLL